MSEELAPSVDDLSIWVGEPITDEAGQKRAGQVLAYAWTLVVDETERAREYWSDLDEVPESVSNVVLQVAGRGWLNPESWGNERTDDWGGGGRPVEELGMYLTTTERRVLRPFATSKLRSIGVLGTMREDTPGPRSGDFLYDHWY